jgi:hypothetical protein
VVAFEGDAIELPVLRRHGALHADFGPYVMVSPNLNRLLMEGPDTWRAIRRELPDLLVDPRTWPTVVAARGG